MEPIKIVIIDDEDISSLSIKNDLERYFKEAIEVFPKFHEVKGGDFNYQNYLINDIIKNSVTTKLESFFEGVNLIIVDQCLISDSDSLGIEVAKKMLKSFKNDVTICLISKNPLFDQTILDDKRVKFVFKVEKTNYKNKELIEIIKKTYNIDNTTFEKSKSLSTQDNGENGAIVKPEIKKYEKIKQKINNFFQEGFRALGALENITKFLLDSFILLFFYALMAIMIYKSFTTLCYRTI